MSSSVSFRTYSNINAFNLSSHMERRILFSTKVSDELDRSTKAADSDVSRKAAKLWTFESICMYDEGWCNASGVVPGFSLLRVQCVFHTAVLAQMKFLLNLNRCQTNHKLN